MMLFTYFHNIKNISFDIIKLILSYIYQALFIRLFLILFRLDLSFFNLSNLFNRSNLLLFIISWSHNLIT